MFNRGVSLFRKSIRPFVYTVIVATIFWVPLNKGSEMIGPWKKSPEERFWLWFKKNETNLRKVDGPEHPYFKILSRQLHSFDPNIAFEIGKQNNDPHEFIVSADGIKEFAPRVLQLIDVAPAIDGWKFTAFRPPMKQFADFNLRFNEIEVVTKDIQFDYGVSGNKVHLQLYIDVPPTTPRDDLIGAGFIAIDSALGEYVVIHHIGSIDFFYKNDIPEGSELLPFTDVAKTVERSLTRPEDSIQQKVSDLDDEWMGILESHIDWVQGWISPGSESKFDNTEGRLALIQQILDSGTIDTDEGDKLEALGTYFGQAIVDKTGWNWKVVHDEYGSDLAIQHSTKSALIFPMSMIVKRVQDDDNIDVLDLFYLTIEQVESLDSAPIEDVDK